MAPTMLDLFGVKIPSYMQGKPLFHIDEPSAAKAKERA